MTSSVQLYSMSNQNDLLAEQMFPLPLTSMEQFHWYDSNRQFNNRVYARYVVKGTVDIELMNLASRYVLHRHPLLVSRVVEIDGKLNWVWDRDLIEQFCVNESRDNQNPDEETWFQVNCIDDGENTELLFELPHVVADGLAGLQLSAEMLQAYHSFVENGPSKAKLRSIDVESLATRGALGLTKSSYLKHLWKQPLGLFGAAKFISRKSLELFDASTDNVDWDRSNQPTIKGMWLDVEASRLLKQKSSEMAVTLNTLFFGELMKTLESFRDRFTKSNSSCVRLLLPMSIRTYADRRATAANRTTIVQVDRTADEINSDGFYSYLDREIKIIRDWELGKLFLLFIRGMSLIPGMLRRSATSEKCRGTAVFTNLAEPLRMLKVPSEKLDEDNEGPVEKMTIGNLRLVDFDFVGPIRYRTPINFSIQKHYGCYRISLHYDPRVVTAEIGDEILSTYLQMLNRLAFA